MNRLTTDFAGWGSPDSISCTRLLWDSGSRQSTQNLSCAVMDNIKIFLCNFSLLTVIFRNLGLLSCDWLILTSSQRFAFPCFSNQRYLLSWFSTGLKQCVGPQLDCPNVTFVVDSTKERTMTCSLCSEKGVSGNASFVWDTFRWTSACMCTLFLLASCSCDFINLLTNDHKKAWKKAVSIANPHPHKLKKAACNIRHESKSSGESGFETGLPTTNPTNSYSSEERSVALVIEAALGNPH